MGSHVNIDETPTIPNRTGGIVLCGGRSSRMGTPKHLLPFGEKTMLQVVVDTLRTVVSPIVVVSAADQELPTLPDDVLLTEDEEPDLGPLAGLCAGLSALADRCAAAFATSCDTPLLQPDVVNFISESRQERDVAVVREGKFFHVLAATYSTRLLPKIRELVAERRLRPLFLIEESDSRIIELDEIRRIDPELLSFRNANTPEDYAAVLALAGLSRDDG